MAADLYVFAEGSIMTPWAQGLYIIPGRGIRRFRNRYIAEGNSRHTLVLAEAS